MTTTEVSVVAEATDTGYRAPRATALAHGEQHPDRAKTAC